MNKRFFVIIIGTCFFIGLAFLTVIESVKVNIRDTVEPTTNNVEQNKEEQLCEDAEIEKNDFVIKSEKLIVEQTNLEIEDAEKIKEETKKQEAVYLGTFKVTAYCPCEKCCGKDLDDPAYGITSTGTVATQGRTIAVYPSQIPYGSIVLVDGVEYIAEDCGGAIKENRLDIYYDSHQDALEWGVRYCEVSVIY